MYLSVLLLPFVLSCAEKTPSRTVVVSVDMGAPVAEVSERFLSVAVDSAQIVGGLFWSPDPIPQAQGNTQVEPYDFGNAKLRKLTAALAPAYLRIGGTDADKLFYDLGPSPVSEAPPGYEYVMTASKWDEINLFASDLDLQVLFTLNAGPGPRNAQGKWTSDNARSLLEYTQSRGYPVGVWELGNEINGYTAIHGFELLAQTYVDDVKTARALIDEAHPSSMLTGPTIAFWPVVGEFVNMYEDVMRAGLGDSLDVLTWHYYPQQSGRCLITTRRAQPGVLLHSETLDEINIWADVVEGLRDEYSPQTPVWLGETGNAQCGGEPFISDAHEGGFWWLDQLGQMAVRGQPVVVRQTLSGSDYGLLDDETLDPNPDYFNSLLWRKLMGTKVLKAGLTRDDPRVRVYAHCAAADANAGRGGVAVVVLNLDSDLAADVELPIGTRVDHYVVTADDLESNQLQLNGDPLAASADGTPPDLEPTSVSGHTFHVPPHAYAFAVIADAGAAACL